MSTARPRIAAEYVLPIRMSATDDFAALSTYLTELSRWVDVTVVDGSDAEVFQRNDAEWVQHSRHVAPEQTTGANGKVDGVMTGLRGARHDAVVIADDDVRYSYVLLREVVARLQRADVVRPQNFFLGRSWHTQWDTGRTLINRAFGSDYPGTLAVRRETLLKAGGYSSEVLFENLELLRTVKAAGGVEIRADDLFIPRVAPSASHFASQRVRQAYDDFAQPVRLIAELSLAAVFAWASVRPTRALAVLGAIWSVAAYGRVRARGAEVFSWTSVVCAPMWVLERAVCVWLAVFLRLCGGVRYRGRRVATAATPVRALRRRVSASVRDSASSLRKL
jgi:hypothetical protein